MANDLNVRASRRGARNTIIDINIQIKSSESMQAILGWRVAQFLLGCVLAGSLASAGGVSPYLPMKLAPEIERQVERLMVMADMPLLIKPFRASDVQRALKKACETPSTVCRQVSDYLDRFKHDAGFTHASASASFADDDDVFDANRRGKFLPNQRGITTDSNYQVSAQGYWQPFDHLIANVGAIAYEGDVIPTAYLTFGYAAAQVDVGWREYWYSPFQDSSMLFSTNAQASPSVALSNSRPLTSWGFRYELFLMKLEETDGILFQGERSSGRPYIAGVHLEIAPLPGWSLAVNRMFQFGGDGRDSSLSTILRAFFDPAGTDNSSTPEERDKEAGNQIASVTSRFNFTGRVPFSVYMEYAGEDTKNSEKYQLGNAALSLGVFFPRVTKNIDLTYELTEWQNGWYVNAIYANGYTNEGSIIGHWGANERVFGDAVGAQTHALKINWDVGARSLIHATYRTVDNENYSSVDYVRSHELQARYTYRFPEFMTGMDLYFGRTTLDDNFVNVGAFVRW
jgi:hypothetical protein